MGFSNAAARHLLPFLARVVIALLLVPTGWSLLTTQSEYSGEDLDRLRSLGIVTASQIEHVGWRAAQDSSASAPESAGPDGRAVPPTEGGEGGANEPPSEQPPEALAPPPGEATPSIDATPEPPPPSEAAATTPDHEGTTEVAEARQLHRLTVMYAAAGLAAPKVLAWCSAFLMLAGGVALLLGLLTRLWAFLFLCLASLFWWIQSWPLIAEHWMLDLEPSAFSIVVADSLLLLVCFALLVTGGGGASLDRAIFRPSPAKAEEAEEVAAAE